MKDVTKIISERATRFLPVDMKDRLKSAFNRNSGNTTPANQPAEDVPDYSAIFNANKPAAGEKKSRFAGPLDQTQIAEPTNSVTMRNPERQISHDNIEEAEIVTEASVQPAANAEAATPSVGSEAAWLKTKRKVDAPAEPHDASVASDIADDAPDYSAIFKGSKPKTAEKNSERAHFEASAPVSPPIKPAVEPKVEEARPTFAAELKSVSRAEVTPASREESRKPEVEVHAPQHEEAQRPKPRFFNGDFNSTESVRLKVEKRNDERPGAEAVATSIDAQARQPSQSESRPAETKPRSEERPAPTPIQVHEARPVERPKDAPRAMPETVALRPATPEPPKTNLQANSNLQRANSNLQKENASMDAKGQESDNGAAARTEGANVAAIAIERNSKFSGQLKFSGAIAIDGQVEGELVAERIVVHEGGVVNATVEGNTVVIAGNVKGDVYARNELEILPSGVVHGSVTAPAINVRRGGRVEGRCAIGVPRQ